MRPDELDAVFSTMKIVDLSWTYSENYPSDYSWELLWDERSDSGPFNGKVTLGEHSGTHIDAPAHHFIDGVTVDELPLDRFFAPVALLDVREKTSSDRDYLITPVEIEQWEKMNGRIPEGIFVFFRTGWEELWEKGEAFLGLDEEGVYHFPGINEETASMLADEIGIKGVGTDCAAIESGVSISEGKSSVHRKLLSKDVYIIESLRNLARIPAAGSFCIALPLKFHKGSGSPVRVMALVNEDY